MLLGKRPRAQAMKRTTSLTEFTIEAGVIETLTHTNTDHGALREERGAMVTGNTRLSSMVSPRNWRRSSGEFSTDKDGFLKTCGLCNRRLAPGKDIYMYRGEIAYCSSECRQQQMAIDERKETCSLKSMIKGDLNDPPASSTAMPETSGGGGAATETVAAA